MAPHDTAVDFSSELQPVEDDIAAINGTLNGGAYDSMKNIEIPVNIKGSKNTDTLTINQRSAENEESPIGCLHGTFPKLVNNRWKCVRKSEYENHVFDFQAGLTDDEMLTEDGGSGLDDSTTTTQKPTTTTDYPKTEETPEYTNQK